ncbi:MAG: hypothetical protein ACRDX9_14305, partial [Acidimicrobiia bacterium]
LRRLGLSYGEVMDLIPVKKSTLATWCREVKLSEEQVEALRARMGSRLGIPVDTNRKRRAEIGQIREAARAQVPYLATDPSWVAGTVLYWAEGAKIRNHLKLANADPRALRLFVWWIRNYLDPDADFSLQLHLHEGNDEAVARSYWRGETGLPNANFYKTFIKPKGTGHRKNHLEHGVCTIKMRRCADAWQTTMVWIEGLTDQLGLRRMPK